MSSTPDENLIQQTEQPSPSDPGIPVETPSSSLQPPASPQRYRLKIAYDGTLFHGWQKQEPPAPAEPLRTVAGVVEQSLIRLLRQPVNLVGASRTDAGVHALGQVAHFDAADVRVPIARLAEAINARLPDDVEVRDAEAVSREFDAISGATWKQYRYRLFNTDLRPLDKRNHVYHCWTALNLDTMRDAAKRIIGEHDFAGMANADHNRLTTVRTIFDCRIETQPPEVQIVVVGSGFLYNMVRIIAGTLVEIGRGRLKPEVIGEIFDSKDRRLAGPTLPASGLWLEWIRYDQTPSRPGTGDQGSVGE